MLTRRRFLATTALGALAPLAFPSCLSRRPGSHGVWVNDVHSQLNRTRVAELVRVDSVEAIRRAIHAAREGRGVAIAGARHAMGGQQFVSGGMVLDTLGLKRVLAFDRTRGLLEVEAGIQWPDVFRYLATRWTEEGGGWGIRQKQTGADRLTLGGALAANVHGRGLTFPPFVSDVESFSLIDAAGDLRRVTRSEDAELFRLATGGYGLFGVVTSLELRLMQRQKVQRDVREATIEEVIPELERRIREGHLYGDFQFAIDPKSAGDFLRRGVLSTYRPVPRDTAIPADQRVLSDEDWKRLLLLAHSDRTRAFKLYLQHYLATSGQVYWSDTQQLGFYQPEYHGALDAALGAREPASEIISELYVPRRALVEFMARSAAALGKSDVSVVYGTVRLIERDDETLLRWARQPYACIIFNLHTPHSEPGLARSAAAFRDLIEAAIALDGSFYLTYHRFATRRQVEAAYPEFPEFLRLKRLHDPQERFQSDWYRHYRDLFA